MRPRSSCRSWWTRRRERLLLLLARLPLGWPAVPAADAGSPLDPLASVASLGRPPTWKPFTGGYYGFDRSGGPWTFWAVSDMWMLTRATTWLESQEELDRLLPPQAEWQRRVGRWIRKVL